MTVQRSGVGRRVKSEGSNGENIFIQVKRIDITAILLGVLALAFFLPVAILFASVIALIVGRTTGGISAGAGAFSFAFGLRRITLVIAFIACLPILVGWIRRKISRHRNTGTNNPGR